MPFIGGDSTDKSDKSNDKYTKERKEKEREEKEREEGVEMAPPVALFSKAYFKITFEERKEMFRGAVADFADKYKAACLEKFYNIWSERNPSGKRMKFELNSTWDLEQRITNWAAGWKAVEEKNEKQTTKNRVQNNRDVATEVLRDLMTEK